MTLSLLLATLLVVVPAPAPDSACTPPTWHRGEMAAAALTFGERAEEIQVLRWRIHEDDRPLHVESAILWLRIHQPGRRGPRWVLASVYRHPRESRPPAAWSLAHIFDVESFRGRTVHDRPPVPADEAALRRVSWWDRSLQSFRMLAGGDCPDAWQAAFGVAPPADTSAVATPPAPE